MLLDPVTPRFTNSAALQPLKEAQPGWTIFVLSPFSKKDKFPEQKLPAIPIELTRDIFENLFKYPYIRADENTPTTDVA